MIAYVLATAADVPASDSWLTRYEQSRCDRFRIEKRRADWRAGRWVAKQAAARTLRLDPALIEVRSAASGAPQSWYRNALLPLALSISHSTGRALSVVSAATPDIGCDLELVESRHSAFAGDWFTACEQRALDAAGDERDTVVTAVWSAKESVLKALHVGLQRDTRTVVVADCGAAAAGWSLLQALDTIGQRRFHVWWRRDGHMVLTVAAPAPSSAAPRTIEPPSRL